MEIFRPLPAGPPVERVKMHYRQIEISPEPQGKACLAAALAANKGEATLFDRAREGALGPQHSQTAYCLNGLAMLLHDQGELTDARMYYQRALATLEIISPKHSNTNRVRRNFAQDRQGAWPCRAPIDNAAR